MAKKRKVTRPLTLSAALRRLAPDDLAALLRGRPEAGAAAASTQAPDSAAIAASLASTEGIGRAIVALDKFKLQLLIVASWLGPAVAGDQLRTQAAGVPVEELTRAARGLSRLGLAFRIGSEQSWSLWVPACVMQAVEGLGDPGPRIGSALEPFTADEIEKLAHALDLRWPRRPRKEIMVERVVALLSDPEVLTSLLGEAPASARHALELIRRDGRASAAELSEAGMADFADFAPAYSFTRGSRRQSSVAWLRSRGLALAEIQNRWQSATGFFVPGEVEVALRGGVLFREWRPRRPPPVVLAGSTRPEQGPDQAVADVEALLEEWTSAPPQKLKAGGLGVRALRKAAQHTGIRERRVSFFYALMVEISLLSEDGDIVTSSGDAADWIQQAPAVKWSALFEAWPQTLLWSDWEDGLMPLSSRPFVNFAPLRRVVLQILGGAPEGQSLDPASLGDSLAWSRPHFFHCEDCAVRLGSGAVEGLVMLGTASSSIGFELLEPARSALVSPSWVDGSNPASVLFPAPVAECTIQADLTVIVPGPPTPELGAGLARFADIKASAPARVYRISDGSVTRALDLGMSAEEMISLLSRHAPRGVPQAVRYLIEDVARRYGRVRVGGAGVYVRADEPDLLAAVLADRRVQKLQQRRLAPTVAVVQGVSAEALLKVLREAGHKPVSEDGGAHVEAPSRTAPILMRSGSDRFELSQEAAEELAAALLGGSPKAADDAAGPVNEHGGRANAAIVEVLQQAERSGEMVELAYRTPEGVSVQRVDPILVNPVTMAAWVVDEQKPRMFETDRIEWAHRLEDQEDDEVHELG